MDTEVGRSIAIMARLRRWAKTAKQQTMVMYFAARDSRTPWAVRLLALAVAAYALSPIDLIPDFIPVLGYLDDIILVPLGLLLVVRLLPPEVLAAARLKADHAADRPVSWVMALIIASIWGIVLTVFGVWIWQMVKTEKIRVS